MGSIINLCNELLEDENTPLHQPISQSMNMGDTA